MLVLWMTAAAFQLFLKVQNSNLVMCTCGDLQWQLVGLLKTCSEVSVVFISLGYENCLLIESVWRATSTR